MKHDVSSGTQVKFSSQSQLNHLMTHLFLFCAGQIHMANTDSAVETSDRQPWGPDSQDHFCQVVVDVKKFKKSY